MAPVGEEVIFGFGCVRTAGIRVDSPGTGAQMWKALSGWQQKAGLGSTPRTILEGTVRTAIVSLERELPLVSGLRRAPAEGYATVAPEAVGR